jgi:hypothetical protein
MSQFHAITWKKGIRLTSYPSFVCIYESVKAALLCDIKVRKKSIRSSWSLSMHWPPGDDVKQLINPIMVTYMQEC